MIAIVLRIFFEWFGASQLHSSFFKKKSNARLIVVCNTCYYYVSIFSQTNCKNKVNYFLGLILVAAPRATIETKSFYWGREKHESCEASHDFASLVYNPVVSNLYQMKAIPAASFGTLPSSFQVIVPHRPAQPSCFSLSYLVRLMSVPESPSSFNSTLHLK